MNSSSWCVHHMMTLIRISCNHWPTKRLSLIILWNSCRSWSTFKLLISLTIFIYILCQLGGSYIWSVHCLTISILVWAWLVLVISSGARSNWWIYWVLINALMLYLFWCWSRSSCPRSWGGFDCCCLRFFRRTLRYISNYGVHWAWTNFCRIQSLLSNRSTLFILLRSIFID